MRKGTHNYGSYAPYEYGINTRVVQNIAKSTLTDSFERSYISGPRYSIQYLYTKAISKELLGK